MRFIIFVFIIISLFSCKKESKISDQKNSVNKVNVSVVKLKKGTFDNNIEIFGRFYPQNQITVFSKIPGKVLSIYFNDGDNVRSGSLLAKVIQDSPFEKFEPYNVISPIDGTVLKRYAEVGMTVNQQTPLFDVGSMKCLVFRGQVFGSDRSKVKNGQIITLKDEEGGELSLSINKISPQVDQITGGLTIEAEICFIKERKVFSGQTISGKILLEKILTYILPVECLVNIKKNNGVFIVDNGRAIFKKINVIHKDESFVYFNFVDSIINDSDLNVILLGVDDVENGTLVEIVQ